MKLTSLILFLIFCLSSSRLFAHGAHEHDTHNVKGPEQTITGELIGLTCFVKHSSKGSEHRDCFKDCASKGLPIGILTSDNKIFQISGEGHADLVSENKKFLKFAEQKVIVKGEVFEQVGVRMIVVRGIKAAK